MAPLPGTPPGLAPYTANPARVVDCCRSGTATRADTIPLAMTKAEQRQSAEVLKLVVERIDQGEVAAPGWVRERLVGAMLGLSAEAQARPR